MGCIVSVIRAAAGIFLGTVIFVGFLFLLILTNFSDKLLNAEFYTSTISEQDFYNRIYDEVLVDQELRDKTADLLGNIKVVSHDDLVGLLRDIVPPEYLQSQVEGSIGRTIDYLNEDAEELEVYIDLGPALINAKTALFQYIDDAIDTLKEEDPGVPDCSPSAIGTLSSGYLERFSQLADGEVPATIPSLKSLPESCRSLLFAATFDQLTTSDFLGPEVQQLLRERKDDLRTPFVAGDTLGMLKASARPLVNPLIDEAIAQVRQDLGPGDRLDLIHQLAEWDPEITEPELRADIREGRAWVTKGQDFGKITTLAMVIAGSTIIMGLIQLPSLANALRWPGLTLVLTGVFFYVVGKLLESEVPERLANLVEQNADKVTEVPPSVTNLGGDLLISFGTQLTAGFSGPSLTLIVIGALLFGASFLVFLVKPLIPFGK